MVSSAVVNTYPLPSYTFGAKEPKMEKDTSVADRLARLKVNYMKEGMRTSVEGILMKRADDQQDERHQMNQMKDDKGG